ncbi:hypothetical protein CAPTEDRAFT_214304 [Capitella teleta]|uniref:Roc domain-containing protein n=1 Tax=Capitella teleta TaxID=283909 RepID=R7VIM3_CAPTE|nr:hypothetical protein CAPTEDRAFT_214304 [Capitella teleta]|eukprot:ELU16141.1 hypothetical protein CAPTEDRAFT_214304 [Capitella teleta]
MGVSPEVTEQLFMKDLPSAITIASSMKQPNFIILPEKMTVEVFLNPFRQILQNWKNQNLHHICLGNMWNTCDGCTSDVHFLDVDPINVENIEDFQTLIENSGVSMALAYHFMLQQKTILPYVQKVFPLLFEEIPAGEILSNLRPILRDYLSYFLLFHRAVMIPLLKGKEERTYSEALTNQMKQMTENSLMLTPSYKCEIHDLLTQRCQLSSVLKAVSSDKKMADYSCCVGSLMTSYDDDGVTALDALFKSFPNLQYLRLTAFPKSDCPLCMPAISILDIKRAGLPEIPQPLKALNQTLTSLTLSYNPIEIIPDWFPTEFSHLRRLVLNHNLIKSLPENFGKLRKLETFSMEPCLLDSLPDSFQQLLDKVMLEKIDDLNRDLSLCFPRFRATEGDTNGGFPKQIIALKNLKRLVLQYQGLTFIPDVVQNLTLLKSLDLSFCSDLTSLGNQLGLCPLTNLLLDDCYGLKTPPKEIREQGMTSTLSYMKRLSQGSSPCYRTKLMFVGLGGVGKTNLMRALMSSDYKAPQIKGEGITDGIDISTCRAVYMLVWNTRLGFEHSGIEFWLSSVSCHCPKAPIFIIGTHADQITNPELPTASLQERYDNIKGFYTTSSITGMGIKQVLDHLLSETLSQPYIGELIPEAWLSLEKDILTQRKDTSLLKWSMIEEKGMLLREAVRFLHELGTLQHFSNELLRDLVIISPQWIVDIMACVVSVHNKVVKDGRLRHEDIKVLWKDHPEELHQWMLHLTEVFDLTFPLSDEPVNLVPCLMPHTEPKISWPNINEIPGGKESKMVYQFKYLPAGLFNRAQVRLHQFSDGSAMWKNGSQLTKNGHTALVKQISATEVLVEAIGPRPENIILLVHEVFESLISESFSGVKYEYLLPCLDCLHLTPKDPAMFSSSILSRALEKKALFLQCHSNFHSLSITDIQNIMPPKSNADYDLQLNNTMRDLDQLQHQFINDVAFIYCRKDIHESDKSVVHPKRIVDDLVKKEVKCWFADDLHDLKIEDVATSITSSKVILILVSDEFVVDTHCQRMFNYIKNTLRKDFCLLMFGKTRDWLKSDIGMQLAHVVYVNFQRLPNYDEKFEELWGQIRRKLKAMPNNQSDKKDVFLSYCWMNSAQALKVGTKGREGSLGAIDPRDMKEYLEKQGISCWLDIECAGKEGLFEDIAEGMRKSKLVLACVSDEVGMLSIGYPKINFQATNENAYPQLLSHIDKVLTPLKEGGKREVEENQGPSTYQELYELAQRKFLRQVSSYVDEVHDGLYPRLLVADLNYQPEEPDPDKPTFVAENLKSGQFCMKILCEYQGGWHCVDEGLPVNIGSSDLVSLWESSGSYMLRILGILKHSKVNLRILNTLDGEKMMNKLQKNTSSFASDSLKEVYNLLRQYVMAQDYESKCGNLKRCHTSSGKMLWLCPEHQSMPGVTVLWKGDLDQNKTKPKMNEPELKLLKALVAINKKADDFQKEKQMNEKDMISEAAKKIENSKFSKIEDVQLEPECKTQGPIQSQPVPQTLIRSVGSAKSEAVSRTDDQTKIARQISARVLSGNNNKEKNMKISTTSQACLIL